MKKCEDTYVKIGTTVTKRAVITTYAPVISEEERERRYEKIKQAAVDLLLATYRAKAQGDADSQATGAARQEVC